MDDIALQDIRLDSEASSAALAALRIPEPTVAADEFAERILARVARSRSAGVPPVARLLPDNRRRLNTIVFLEDALGQRDEDVDLDFSPLVLCACGLLENELDRTLAGATRHAAGPILDVLAGARAHDVVAGWLERRLPWTMGTAHATLTGWRRLAAQSDRGAETLEALTHRYDGPFYGALLARGLEHSLGRIRNEFRNPLSHGATCTADTFAEFAALTVGTDSFLTWMELGPGSPPDDIGILHHHLVSLRPEASP